MHDAAALRHDVAKAARMFGGDMLKDQNFHARSRLAMTPLPFTIIKICSYQEFSGREVGF
jgi:hypothetical protein